MSIDCARICLPAIPAPGELLEKFRELAEIEFADFSAQSAAPKTFIHNKRKFPTAN
jgi:hypothetical protein